MDLYIDVKKLSVGGWCIWIITSALVLFLSFEIDIGDGPGPKLEHFMHHFIVSYGFRKQPGNFLGHPV